MDVVRDVRFWIHFKIEPGGLDGERKGNKRCLRFGAKVPIGRKYLRNISDKGLSCKHIKNS